MRKNTWTVWILAALLALQASYLLTYYYEEVAPFPPRYNDQASYLRDSYSLSWRAGTSGLGEVLAWPLKGVSANGALFITEGALLDLFAGGGRLSQLLLNFAAFMVAQLAVYACITHLTGRPGLGFAAVGLFLTQHSMWNGAGGIFDFRIDFLALCLYGIALCAALRSRSFASRRWTIITALAMATLVLNRFITAAYMVGVLGTMIVVHVAMRSRARALNALLCLATLALIAAPFFIASRGAIYNYYVVNDILGPEKTIRAAQEGVVSWVDELTYYPLSIAQHHLGEPFGIAWMCLAIGMAISLRRFLPKLNAREFVTVYLPEVLLLVASVVVPVLILTLDVLKTPVVGGVVCIPLTLLIVLLPRWLGLIDRDSSDRGIWLCTGGAILAIGMATQLDWATRERLNSGREDAQRWAAAAAWIFDDAQARQMTAPRVFFDTDSDRLSGGVFTTFGYERTRSLLLFATSFGDAIASFEPSSALAGLAMSDYVILTSGPKVGPYPFFASMTLAEPRVRSWTQHHLILRRSFDLDGETVEFYSRPVLDLTGVSGDWLLAQGTSLRLVPKEIKPGQIVALRGPDTYRRFLPQITKVSAIATSSGDAPLAVAASFHHSGNQYEIYLDPSPLRGLGDKHVDIALSFDHAFVPRDRGINADPRHLVVLAPTDVALIPRPVQAAPQP